MNETLENRRWRLVFRCLWIIISMMTRQKLSPGTAGDRYYRELEEEIERDI